MSKLERALISVSDKTGIVDFAGVLKEIGIKIISTGGTAKVLESAGIPITGISDITGFPEMLDGRVKTLHPRIHGGILGVRNNPDHVTQMKAHGISPIDMVIVNLYPFEATISKVDVTLEDAIENIDIGGPTLIRSAAKNYKDVAIVVDPNLYSGIAKELKSTGGEISLETRKHLAVQAFQHVSFYDSVIHHYLQKNLLDSSKEFPNRLLLSFKKKQELRYGENPHQSAAFYADLFPDKLSIVGSKQLQGKELSFNNFLDLNSALAIVQEFSQPAAVVIKHTNPCGTATASNLRDAYIDARQGDPLSAYGSVVALNQNVDVSTANEIITTFVECVIAPSFSPAALITLQAKKNLRVLELPPLQKLKSTDTLDFRRIIGGMLVQTRDVKGIERSGLKVVTDKTPSEELFNQMLFAWKILKHVKSNAIILAKNFQLIGVGAGQMSRIDSVLIAIRKAGPRTKGAIMASDAFIPFPDAIEEASKAGILAIIQPGGSIRDKEVIAVANGKALPMVFTGSRCFKH